MRQSSIHCANFFFIGQSVALSADHDFIISKLAALFDLPVMDYGPADYSITLRRDADGFVVDTSHGLHERYETISDALVALAMMIPVMLLPFKSKYIVHGGAFIANGKCHLLIGPGHIGKSTLALEAWRRGYEILGDDYLLLDLSTTTLQAVPKPLKLRLADGALPECLEKIITPRDYCLGYARDSWTLILSRGLPRMTALQHMVPIASINLLMRTADKTSYCHPASRHQFLGSIYEQLVAAPRNNLDIFKCLSPMFRDGHVSTLHIGENATAAAVEAIVARF